MADVLRTGISVREQEVHIERPDGVRGIALVEIEAIKDTDGYVVGAVNCFQDITERKRSEAQIVNLAREAEHRTKNILATVLATVRLSRADTSDDLKRLIKGASMPWHRSMGCSCNRAGREPSFILWSHRSFRLTAARERGVCELTDHP